jgi:hypothetical protein
MQTLRKSLLNKALWMLSAALFSIWIASLFLCSADRSVALDQFEGVWKTTAKKYNDRFFEISDSTITFGTGEGTQDIYFIHGVTKSSGNEGIVITLSFDNTAETQFELSFYYKPYHGSVIYFKNQRDIKWTRVNSMQGKKSSDISNSKKL